MVYTVKQPDRNQRVFLTVWCLEQTLLGWQWHYDNCPSGVFCPECVKSCCTSSVIPALLFHLDLYITYWFLALINGHQQVTHWYFICTIHQCVLETQIKVFRSSLCCCWVCVCFILNYTLLLIFLRSFHSHIKTFILSVIFSMHIVLRNIGEGDMLILDCIKTT